MLLSEEHNFKRYPELTNGEMEMLGFLSPHEQITSDFVAVVYKVHDGDTVRLTCDFRDFDFPLRLAKIDAPELDTGARGVEARDYLAGIILGEEVLVMVDRFNRVDKYGRLLGTIMFAGQDVGEMMVHAGFAHPFGFRREGEIAGFDQRMVREKWF